MTDLNKLELDIAGKILAATIAAWITRCPVGGTLPSIEDQALDALDAAKILVANRRGA